MDNIIKFNFSYDPSTGILRNDITNEEIDKIEKDNTSKISNSIAASIKQNIAQYDHQIKFNNYMNNPELGEEDPEYIIEKYYGKFKSWAPTNTKLFKKVVNELLRRGRENKNNSEVIDLNFIDTKNIKSMTGLFNGLTSSYYRRPIPPIDISKWDVSNVTNMRSMFRFTDFTNDIDISNWDVSNVRDMNSMFLQSNFNGDISKWDVSNVRDMNYMFNGSKFRGDISNWNVSSLQHADAIFGSTSEEKSLPEYLPAWYKNIVRNRSKKESCLISNKAIDRLQERKAFSKDIRRMLNR